jgi:DNA-binding transcriptional LysR family regulator
MLSVERLRALRAVAEHGSVMAAAESLHVTTSAISQQLSKLEADVGHTLLERHGRGVRLTEAATLLVAHTERVMSVLEQAEAELDAARTAVAGRLSIAAFATAARAMVPHAIRELRARYPQLEVVFAELEPAVAIPQLVRRDFDLVIAQDWMNAPLVLPPGLSKAPLVDDVADVALPATHRLAKSRSIKLDDLAGEPWITWHSGSICHDWLVHTLRRSGHEPRVAHTAAEHETQLALVAAGLGIAVNPRLGRGAVPTGVRLVPVTPSLRRHVYAVWRSDATRRKTICAGVAAFEAAVSRQRGTLAPKKRSGAR